MKKKYLALVMSCILCTSAFVTGCGNTADVIEDDEDEDDDDEDDDEDDDDKKDDKDDEDDDKDYDKDDDKDDREEKPVYVESIDPSTLLDQVKVFVKNKDQWSIPNDLALPITDAAYALTDLDHNGRAELLVIYAVGNDDTTSTTMIYEINEKGTKFDLAEWEFSGLNVTPSPSPDLLGYPFPLTYYDDKTGITHYLALESYDDGCGNSGVCDDDFTYSDGKASSYTYAAAQTYEYYDISTDELKYKYTYITDKGDVTEDQYYDYRYDYAGGIRGLDECSIGIYIRSWFDDLGVMNLDDEFLRDVLIESYRVFSGYQTYSGFYQMYNDPYAPGDYDETFYERCIGTWKLWYSEIEGDTTFYEEDGPTFATLTISEDYTATIMQYRDGRLSLQYGGDIYFDDNDHPYFDYTDQDTLPEGFMMERYTITEINSDGDLLTVYLDFFGEDGMLGGTTLKFLGPF